MQTPLLLSLALALMVLLALAHHPVRAAKSQKEYATRFSKKNVERMEREELIDQMGGLDRLKQPQNDANKPTMIFAKFRPGITKEEGDFLASKWATMLRSAAVHIDIFETGKDTWCVTTKRMVDNAPVLEFLAQQEEVMKTTIGSNDRWNLPRYLKEYNEEMGAKAKASKQDL